MLRGSACLKKGESLFDDDIEAWEHGPIVFVVYQKYKLFEDASILYDIDMVIQMPEECADILMKVALEYGKFTASALRNKTHVPNGPWDRVFVKGQYHTVIPLPIIKEFFDKNEQKITDIDIPLSEEDLIRRRDEDGYLVLPKEWDETTVA